MKDDAEFREFWAARPKDPSPNGDAFVTEMLTPILIATGAVEKAEEGW